MSKETRTTCRKQRWQIFALTFLSYALYHASRKVFSAIKSVMGNKQWLHSKHYKPDEQVQMDGILDTLFMLFYAVGLFCNGYIGDRVDSKFLICTGMWLSSLMLLLFGIGAVIDFHALDYYAVIWAVNGLVQSTGWPANVSVMARWYKSGERGFVMGLWSANASFGNIMGTFIVVVTYACLGVDRGWIASLFVVAFFVFLEAVFVYAYLIPDPTMLNHEHCDDTIDCIEDSKINESNHLELITGKLDKISQMMIQTSNQNASVPIQRPIPFLKAWLIPGVIPYSLCYACIKVSFCDLVYERP